MARPPLPAQSTRTRLTDPNMNLIANTVLPALSALLLLGGCVGEPRQPAQLPDLPAAWQRPAQGPVTAHWLAAFKAPYLSALVDRAIAENHALAQQRTVLENARKQADLARARRLPGLDLTLTGQRGRAQAALPVTEQFELGAALDFPLDLWGKLGDAEREAVLALGAAQARYQDAEQRLAAQVVSAGFNAQTAMQLLELFEQRLANLLQFQDVIESAYRSGLNPALDVYLARNTVEQERANVASQRQQSMQAITALELLLSDYPDGRLQLDQALPEFAPAGGAGAPADLLRRRPDLRQAWLELLAADAGLAVAHKNRFPDFSLRAVVRDNNSAFGQLLDGGALAWTTAASLAQPLFQGGRLQALHEQARLRVEQAEHRYLEAVYNAFAEVENELSRALTLEDRVLALRNAKDNAEAALELALDQYQRGLISYTTVLESQRRAFDAQTAVVQLRNQLLQSRVALSLALGGDF